LKITTVYMQTGEPIRAWGEIEFDPISNSLIIRGETGNYLAFYWPFVAYYTVTEAPGGPPVHAEEREPVKTH
jgi:hypothetical protein